MLDALFAPLHRPSAGIHGLERRTADGRVLRPEVPEAALNGARTAFARFAAAHDGTIFEDKGIAVALHFRQAPRFAGEADRSEERRVGKEWVSTCRYRWSPHH